MDQSEKKIKHIISDLKEREKELNCLYKIENILSNFDSDIIKVLKKLVKIIPLGWQFPDICKVSITYEDKTVTSDNFSKSELKQTAKIIIDEKAVGEIHVYYIKPVRTEKRIFLFEEQKLLNTISNKLSIFINYQKLKQKPGSISDKDAPAINKNDEFLKLKNWLLDFFLSDSDINDIIKAHVYYKKGETICKQGTYTSYAMIQASGLSKLYVEDTNEKIFNFKLSKPICFIGLSTLFGNQYFNFSAQAILPSSIYLIEKEAIKKLLHTNTKFTNKILELISNDYEFTLTRMSVLANKHAHGRIAELLLYMHENIHENITESSLSRKDIAEFAGMSTENAVRILSELKNDNIIKINKNGIEIINHDLLKIISKNG